MTDAAAPEPAAPAQPVQQVQDFLQRFARLETSLDDEGRSTSWQRLASAQQRLSDCLDQEHECVFRLAASDDTKALRQLASHVDRAFQDLTAALEEAHASVQRMRANVVPFVADAIEILARRPPGHALLPPGTTHVTVDTRNPGLGYAAAVPLASDAPGAGATGATLNILSK